MTLTGVEDVVDLTQARERRAERLRRAAEHAARHPALRWQRCTGDDAHRRDGHGGTACGRPGPLRLADPAAGLCPDCYPPARA